MLLQSLTSCIKLPTNFPCLQSKVPEEGGSQWRWSKEMLSPSHLSSHWMVRKWQKHQMSPPSASRWALKLRVSFWPMFLPIPSYRVGVLLCYRPSFKQKLTHIFLLSILEESFPFVPYFRVEATLVPSGFGWQGPRKIGHSCPSRLEICCPPNL